MVYTLSNTWTQLTETTGVLQNNGTTKVEFMSGTSAPTTMGLMIDPHERFKFSVSTIGSAYVRSVGGTGEVTVDEDEGK